MPTTTNFGWPQHAIDETGWGAAMDAMILQQDGLPHFLPKHLVRYVDYANGNDGAAATRGLGPGYAYKTIQAAYDELVTTATANFTAFGGALGVGRIILLPGDHDIGAGVTINSQRPCELVGFRAGENDYYVANSGARIVSTSSGVTAFITVSHATSTAHGMRFRDLHFQTDDSVSTSLTKIISTVGCDNVHFDHCTFINVHGTTPTLSNTVTAIYMVSGTPGDNAWFRIRDCESTSMQFFSLGGVNANRSVIDGNVCFNSGTRPTMYFNGDLLTSMISNNDLSGSAVAIECATGAINDNIFINNAGESPNNTNPFYSLTGSIGRSQFIGGHCNCADNSNGTWINFSANAWNNIVVGWFDSVGLAGHKMKIVDNSTGGKNIVVAPNWGVPIRRFTTFPITDSLFHATRTPPDGTQAISDVGGVRHLSTRSGGAWYSVVVV